MVGLPGYDRQGKSWYETMWRWPIRWEKTTSACCTTPARAHEQEERRCSTHWWDSPSTPGTREGTSVEWQLSRKLGQLSQTLPTHKPAARTALSPCPTPRRAGTACSPWTPPAPPVSRSSETRNSTAGTRRWIKTPGRPGPPMAPNRRRRTRWWRRPAEAQSHGATPSLPPSPLCRQLAPCTSLHASPCLPSESEDPRLTLPQTSSKLEFLLFPLLKITLKAEIKAIFNFYTGFPNPCVPSELKFNPRNGWRMSFAPQAWVLSLPHFWWVTLKTEIKAIFHFYKGFPVFGARFQPPEQSRMNFGSAIDRQSDRESDYHVARARRGIKQWDGGGRRGHATCRLLSTSRGFCMPRVQLRWSSLGTWRVLYWSGLVIYMVSDCLHCTLL